MENISKLKIPKEPKEFEFVLKKLKDVHFLCGYENLPYNYKKIINDFSSSWHRLKKSFNISTTPKLHIIIDHLIDYFDLTEMDLRKTTDEVTEAMHSYVHK